MIPKWLEDLRPYQAWIGDAAYKASEELTRDETVFQMLREDIDQLMWIYENLEVSPKQDKKLRVMMQWKEVHYHRYAKLQRAGQKLSPQSKKVREAIDQLGIMPEAVKMATGNMGDLPPQEFNRVAAWLREKVQRQFPKLPVAPATCLRACKKYLQEHIRQPIG